MLGNIRSATVVQCWQEPRVAEATRAKTEWPTGGTSGKNKRVAFLDRRSQNPAADISIDPDRCGIFGLCSKFMRATLVAEAVASTWGSASCMQ